MGWKKGLLPETNFSGDVRKNFRKARDGDFRALRWLEESEDPDATLAADTARMWIELEKVSGTDLLSAHLQTAVRDRDQVRRYAAQTHVKNLARKPKSGEAEKAAAAFLELRLQWPLWS